MSHEVLNADQFDARTLALVDEFEIQATMREWAREEEAPFGYAEDIMNAVRGAHKVVGCDKWGNVVNVWAEMPNTNCAETLVQRANAIWFKTVAEGSVLGFSADHGLSEDEGTVLVNVRDLIKYHKGENHDKVVSDLEMALSVLEDAVFEAVDEDIYEAEYAYGVVQAWQGFCARYGIVKDDEYMEDPADAWKRVEREGLMESYANDEGGATVSVVRTIYLVRDFMEEERLITEI